MAETNERTETRLPGSERILNIASGYEPALILEAAVRLKVFDALDDPGAPRPSRVLDLAAGSGVWGAALAEASERVRVTAIDWPTVLPVTRKIADRHGVADRFTFVPGDLTQVDFGCGHDVATLGH